MLYTICKWFTIQVMDKMTLRKNIGTNIKILRTKKNWSQETLAEKAGTIQQYIERIENQKSEVGSHLLVNIAEALDVSVDTLIHEIKI